MTRKKGKHLSRENREVIEAGIRGDDPARAIAKRIDASPSTVTREVRAHRTVREKKLSPAATADTVALPYGFASSEIAVTFWNARPFAERNAPVADYNHREA